MSDLPPAIASWRDQIDRLSPHASPCRYLAPAKWAAMRENALAFIDRFGAEADRLGWTAPQLFGVHPQHGTVRVDFCGAPMIAAAPASGIEATRVLFERTSAYRNLPGQQWGVTVWEFAARADWSLSCRSPRILWPPRAFYQADAGRQRQQLCVCDPKAAVDQPALRGVIRLDGVAAGSKRCSRVEDVAVFLAHLLTGCTIEIAEERRQAIVGARNWP